MNFFKEIFSIDNDKNSILKENRRLKTKTKNAHKKMEEMEEEKDEMMDKKIE